MSWYAVYTKSRWEKKVADLLQRKGYESYLPIRIELKQWSDRKKKVEVPVLPSYVFVKVDKEQLSEVRYVDGVINYVYWLGKPALIKQHEIDEMKLFLKNEGELKIGEIHEQVGKDITLQSEAFKNQEAKVLKVDKNKIELYLYALNIKMTIKRNQNN